MASKRRLRRIECGGKQQFTSGEAVKVATKMRRDYPGQSFDGYPCPHGDHWHVGHRTKEVHKEIEKRRLREA